MGAVADHLRVHALSALLDHDFPGILQLYDVQFRTFVPSVHFLQLGIFDIALWASPTIVFQFLLFGVVVRRTGLGAGRRCAATPFATARAALETSTRPAAWKHGRRFAEPPRGPAAGRHPLTASARDTVAAAPTNARLSTARLPSEKRSRPAARKTRSAKTGTIYCVGPTRRMRRVRPAGRLLAHRAQGHRGAAKAPRQ